LVSGLFLLNITGCVALVAGTAAGGAGTAIWLSEKLTQQFNAPYEQAIGASESALTSLNLKVNKETRVGDVTQIKSKYTNGKEIWIDIHKITEHSSRVEVRVGAVKPDKEAADKILKSIQGHLQ